MVAQPKTRPFGEFLVGHGVSLYTQTICIWRISSYNENNMNPRNGKQYSEDYFQELLREAGYKITPARLHVLKVLSTANRPLSAGEILDVLLSKNRNVQVNHVTIYRSLNAFENDSLVRRVPIDRGSHHYELADTTEHYFMCTECGDVQVFKSSIANQISRDVVRETGGIANRHSVQAYGICRECQ